MAASEQGYIEAEDTATAWQWWIECEETQRPFVVVRPLRGRVILQMEHSGRRLNAAGIEAVRRAILAAVGGPDLGGLQYGDFTRVDGLPLADCHTLAQELVKIATTEAYLEVISGVKW